MKSDAWMRQFKNIMTQSACLILMVILAALIMAPWGNGVAGFEVIAGLAVIALAIYRLGMLL